MLVLSRKPGEQIVLPHYEVTMTVLGVSGNRVRIGVAAPAGTAVHRREVWDKIASRPVNPVSEHGLQGYDSP
jgi:carbon storage regulator